jgi:hypothetical protein
MIAARRAISDTERRFPVRIRIGVPPRGLGDRLDQIQTWLDANCGADGWAMAPAGLRGPLNDAIAIYFNDATLAAAFVARWCAGYRAESTDGVFQIREDEPTPLSLRYCVALDGSFASGAASRRKSDLNPFGKNGHRRESASNSENRVGSPYSGETPGPDSRPRHPPILALFRDPATPSRWAKSRVEHAFETLQDRLVIVPSMPAPVASGWSESPGGPCTHWEKRRLVTAVS